MSFWLSGKSIAQVICWDRGRPARNEREAENWIETATSKAFAPAVRLRAGAPAVPNNHLNPW